MSYRDMKPIYFFFFVFFIFCLPLQAQNTASDSTSLSRELTIEREYNPDIGNATKVNQLPELREPQAPKSKVEFSNYAIPYSIQPELYQLPVQLYQSDINRIKKTGYLTVGISSSPNIDGDFGIQLLNTAKNYIGIQASHRSSHSNVTYLQNEEKQKMKINDNWGNIHFLHNFEKVRLNMDATYTYAAFNYYGFTLPNIFAEMPSYSSSLITNKDLTQVNNLFETNAGIESSGDQDLSFLLKLNYRRFGQKYGNYTEEDGRAENQFKVDAGLATDISQEIAIAVNGGIQTFSYSSFPYEDSSFGNVNYSVIRLNPHLKVKGNNWNLRLGIKEEFQIGKNKEANFSPDIWFDFMPKRFFRLDFIATGGIKDNSNYNLFYENRYLNPAYRLKDARSPLDLRLNLGFLPADNLKLDLFGGFKIIKDEHFMHSFREVYSFFPGDNGAWNSYLTQNYMLASYFDVDLLNVGLGVSYSLRDRFELKVKGAYNKWSERVSDVGRGEFIPYGKPDFIGDINLGFKAENLPLRIDAYYHLETGRTLWHTSNDSNTINDLSLKATYSLNDTFSFYAKANNLLFQEYDFFYGHPAQSFNIMGGLSIKF